MTPRVLLIEPDERGGALIERTLAALGCSVDRAASIAQARDLLGREDPRVAVVDELAGDEPLGDVRALREHHPRVPVVVTGTLLTARTLRELLVLRCAGALPKPFAPAELRALVASALRAAEPSYEDARDFSAALTDARALVLAGDPSRARGVLRRAHAAAPLEPAAVRLEALCAELLGEDPLAGRLYRAALALETEPTAEGPDALEGLARLDRYAREGLVVRAAPLETAAAGTVRALGLGLAAGSHARYYRGGSTPTQLLEVHAGEAPVERTEAE